MIIRVPGEPIPQGSKRCYGNRVVDVDPARLKRWRQRVADTARAVMLTHGLAPLEGAVAVELTFLLLRPPSHRRASGDLTARAPVWPRLRRTGDTDKLTRAVLDSLTDAGVWDDDAQVCQLHACKRYADPATMPGLVAQVRALPDLPVTTVTPLLREANT